MGWAAAEGGSGSGDGVLAGGAKLNCWFDIHFGMWRRGRLRDLLRGGWLMAARLAAAICEDTTPYKASTALLVYARAFHTHLSERQS